MGIAEFGVMLNSYLAVQNAAREGARLAIVGGADADIKSLIISISPGLAADDIAVSIIPSEGSRISGNMLTVNVTYNYHVTVPIINNLLNNAIQLKAQTSMRIE
jgi:Flp pilus assembly protein TadG